MTDPTIPDAFKIALDLPDLPGLQTVPPTTVCAMTGVPITTGIPLRSILSDATADIATMFPMVQSGWVSASVAAVFRTKLTGNLILLEEPQGWQIVRPLVSRESAIAQERPCWTEFLCNLRRGQRTIAILSDDVQRRLWPLATCAVVGPTWSVYLHAAGLGSQQRTIDYARFRQCLSAVEDAYTTGYPKDAIQTGLLSLTQQRRIQEIGVARTAALETRLVPYRHTNEMAMAIFIAQKREEPK